MSSNKKRSKEDSDDDHSNETFVKYGTELPDITTSGEQDRGKFQPVWKQEVRDEQGLRRFHGAFKGGWSAGYFNTVGSKEGWSPSTFVSSRKNRTDRKDFKPEDFMDEEDLEELLKNQEVVATDEFDSFGSTERELEKKRMLASSMEASGSVLGALPDKFIDDLVLPNKDPVGVRLLKAMGWREGQGIGPRISKIQNDDSEYLESDTSALFAPKNTEIIAFDQKSNTYGLDFDSFKNAPEFIPQSSNIKGDSYLHRKKDQNSSIRGKECFSSYLSSFCNI
ncbi:14050_t:CDS:2 [Funneliformis geosporum]|uniref:1418_t:CDS:1 n=1 Tax=Funneliformis geosporum TaxID=1117311 RepID=A0A9W4SID3_9GLOM|nr:14050_t:CDS:2 [Funneliformis geosporum]CAI2170656.1 1418_t:CDS:2 [Funneliformis geosporum]